MSKLGRITDYGLMVLLRLAQTPQQWQSARLLAEALALPQPTVGKILKLLHRGGLVNSLRGAQGGYRLSKPPGEISLTRIIAALEEPFVLMACSPVMGRGCERLGSCPSAPGLQRVEKALQTLLGQTTLEDLGRPVVAEPEPLFPLSDFSGLLPAEGGRIGRNASPFPAGFPLSNP